MYAAYETGARIYYLTDGFEWRSEFIAARHYQPDPTLIGDDYKGNIILHEWAEDVLGEVGLSIDGDLYGSVTDCGADVRKMCQDAFKRQPDSIHPRHEWEWCLSHLGNICLVEAFGIKVDRKKSANEDMRKFFDEVQSVHTSINHSEGALTYFKDIQWDLYKTKQRLKNVVPQRWSSSLEVGDRLCGVVPSILISIVSTHTNE